MKRILFLFIFIIVSTVNAQDFEGVINYSHSYVVKNKAFAIEKLEKEFGTKSVVYIKNGFYKTIDEADYMSMHIYRYDESRLYYFNRNKDTLYFISTLDNRFKGKFKYLITKNADTILGEICNKLEVKIKPDLTFVYYFSSKYSINPSFYKNFTFMNKNEILNRMKAVYLRFIVINNDYIYSSEAVKITRKELDDSIFDIPKHKILIKKP